MVERRFFTEIKMISKQEAQGHGTGKLGCPTKAAVRPIELPLKVGAKILFSASV
jgi:hypothetical protein